MGLKANAIHPHDIANNIYCMIKTGKIQGARIGTLANAISALSEHMSHMDPDSPEYKRYAKVMDDAENIISEYYDRCAARENRTNTPTDLGNGFYIQNKWNHTPCIYHTECGDRAIISIAGLAESGSIKSIEFRDKTKENIVITYENGKKLTLAMAHNQGKNALYRLTTLHLGETFSTEYYTQTLKQPAKMPKQPVNQIMKITDIWGAVGVKVRDKNAARVRPYIPGRV